VNHLAILGAGGHGKVVADAALLQGCSVIAFFDDDWPRVAATGPWPVSGTLTDLVASGPVGGAVVAIGDNTVRLARQRTLAEAGIFLFTVVHPRAAISPFAEIGAGSVIFAGAVVNAFARLGLGCIVNTAATVDHDCVLADGVHLSPGAHLGGGVSVGLRSTIGIGASVKHGVSIGADVMIGAGAAVIDHIPDGMTVVGVPARPIVRLDSSSSL
jgi:sugar O-acyltransferase (sialic acid O-acetyltransferase NeuD family)